MIYWVVLCFDKSSNNAFPHLAGWGLQRRFCLSNSTEFLPKVAHFATLVPLHFCNFFEGDSLAVWVFKPWSCQVPVSSIALQGLVVVWWCVVGCRLPHHSGETTPPQHKGIHLWTMRPGTTGINIFQLWHDRLDTPYLTYSYILSDKPHNSEYVEKNNCPLSSKQKRFHLFLLLICPGVRACNNQDWFWWGGLVHH